MSRTYFDRSVPIAALATPEGRSALAVIRVSGPGAIEAVARCFSRPEALRNARGYQAVHGWVRESERDEAIDEVVALVFRAPHSFTGEDSVELMCHGSPAVASRILELLYAHGIEPALPGEFSFRAFVEGKTDLVQAEAINELTHASCEAARRDALARLSGTLSARLGDIRSRMVDLLAEMNACLDYPEDEVMGEISEGHDEAHMAGVSQAVADLAASSPASMDSPEQRWLSYMADMIRDIEALVRSYPGARLRQEGFLVVIAGRPNAGKSSLFNLLVREE
ncbi:MAG: 50S ribosome-binding GTPase, partial [Rectinema sp.]|nr:50S ribosome-binding GTPase [Rectinema sp.]